MASNTETKVPLNINWDFDKKIWHIMVLSEYVEYEKETLVASCQYKHDTTKTFKNKLHRDWLDKPLFRFPDGKLENFDNGDHNLNFKNMCSTCINKETNIKEFKVWLIVQKLKHL